MYDSNRIKMLLHPGTATEL